MALKKMYVCVLPDYIDKHPIMTRVNLKGARGKTEGIYRRSGKVVLFDTKKQADDFLKRTGRLDPVIYNPPWQSAMLVWDVPDAPNGV